jgi:hypothetical protein
MAGRTPGALACGRTLNPLASRDTNSGRRVACHRTCIRTARAGAPNHEPPVVASQSEPCETAVSCRSLQAKYASQLSHSSKE